MADMTMARLHEMMVVLYAVSLVFYFIDYLNKDKIAHRSAFWILSVVYLLQTVFLVMYIIETKRFPVLTLFEGIYFYAWLLITLSILLHLFYKVGYAVFFLNVIGFIFMTIHTFAPVQIETIASWRSTYIGVAVYPYYICDFVLCGICDVICFCHPLSSRI